MHLGRYLDAVRDFDRSLELEPNDAYALSRRGSTYRELRRYIAAGRDLRRAIQLDPRDTWAFA
jgi:Flp pilus assembly protein TadD